MPKYVVKQRRQLFGRVYEKDDIVEVATKLEDLPKGWERYLEYESEPVKVAKKIATPPPATNA